MKNITIVGAGLVGGLLAVMLAKRGHQVNIYERRSDPRKEELNGGRSINLVVSHRGWTALERADLKDEVRKITVPVYGRMMHDRDGQLHYHAYSAIKKAIHSVSRGALNELLITAAERHPNVNVHFEHSCIKVDLDRAACIFRNEATGEQVNVAADLVVGSDGAFSVVRRRMLGTRFDFSQRYIEHDYKELLIPPGPDGSPQLDPQALHIWPRGSFMMMGLANLDGGFTGTMFWPAEGENSFAAIKSESDLKDFFGREFPDALPLVPDLSDQYFSNPTSTLISVTCDPWHYRDKAMLIGDAAHAIVPFYGEGMNCGFEDCRIFDELLEQHGDGDMGRVLTAYSASRVKNGHAIAELSMRNFVEMRDRVADPMFLLRKKIEAKLYIAHPDKWLPLYSQVKFTNIPYTEALSEGIKHDRVMEQIMADPDIERSWDSDEVRSRALALLERTT